MLYTRYGNNPNQVDIAKKYAMLEGAETALFLSSGMAATALAHLAMLRPGDHLRVELVDLRRHEEAVRRGVRPLRHHGHLRRTRRSRASWRQALRPNTRAIFVETPTNPLMRVLDLAPIAKIARHDGIGLLVDATFASPINFRPLEHGADVVISSATKYLNGHSDVIAGAVAGSNSVIEEVTRLMKLWGSSLDPHSAWLIDRGMRTLVGADGAAQPQRHGARHLGQRPPGDRARCTTRASPRTRTMRSPKRLLDGYGGMLGLELAGGTAAAERMLGRLQLIAHAPSLAGRREPRFRTPTDVAHGPAAPRAARRWAFPTDSSASAADSRMPMTSSPTWSRRWMAE